MAGNIIPAIATTNAIIAGVIVMHGLLVLQDQMDKCNTIYLNRSASISVFSVVLNSCLLTSFFIRNEEKNNE